MPRKTTQPPTEPAPEPPVPAVRELPRMLSLEQVQEVLNMKAPQVYSLVRSGELKAAQFGGGVWRVRQDDLLAYIDAAYTKTAERIASGQIPEGETTPEA
jgi:excisionase family DNA binding protein